MRSTKYIMQLIYLLLKRYLRVIKLACKIILDRAEFDSSLQSLKLIFDAGVDRIKELTGE
jgi:hypothetical protein